MKHIMIDGTRIVEYLRIRQSFYTSGGERVELEKAVIFACELMSQELEKERKGRCMDA